MGLAIIWVVLTKSILEPCVAVRDELWPCLDEVSRSIQAVCCHCHFPSPSPLLPLTIFTAENETNYIIESMP